MTQTNKKNLQQLRELIQAKKGKMPQMNKFNKSFGMQGRIIAMQTMQRASGKRGK